MGRIAPKPKAPAPPTAAELAAEAMAAEERAYGSGPLAWWLGQCRDAMRRWVYGPEHHAHILRTRRALEHHGAPADDTEPFTTAEPEREIDGRVSHCHRALAHLQRISFGETLHGHPIHGPDELVEWTVRTRSVVLRMAAAGFLPKPPQSVLDELAARRAPTPTGSGISRAERMDAEPTDAEDAFR